MDRWISVNERLPQPERIGQQRGLYNVKLSNGTVKDLAYEFEYYEDMIFPVGWRRTDNALETNYI